jgi:tRNA (uracil-5-)-methyltransferase
VKKRKKELIEQIAEQYRGSAMPECPHFGECGGCMFQDISYQNQLLIKKEYLQKLFEDSVEVKEVIGENPYHYRNRMDFVCAFGKRGLRKRGFFKHVVDIESCKIMQENSNTFWSGLREFLADVEDHDYVKHNGYLRYVVLRQAAFTGEVMCNFVTSTHDERLGRALEYAVEHAQSVSQIISPGLADVSFGEVKDIKNGHITEQFDAIKYNITPNSFFQSNSAVALKMYKCIAEFAEGRTLDLYCGVGTISLFAAQKCESVTGVEIIEEAVTAAKENAALNEIANCTFVAADARVFMKENTGKFDTLILDPPRSGMHPKMIRAIEELAPPKIVYMSCNPSAFKLEMPMLENYRLELFEAHDMFPQTPHVEAVAVLKRK